MNQAEKVRIRIQIRQLAYKNYVISTALIVVALLARWAIATMFVGWGYIASIFLIIMDVLVTSTFVIFLWNFRRTLKSQNRLLELLDAAQSAEQFWNTEEAQKVIKIS